ncbi:MAG: A24 family peptidase [Rhodoferax sp.]|uniref:prepilin peptidase n=2 Tax=Rhodoferax sp. TaxID=50421 RepID=UPI0008C29C20|nr:A24 family peptidase [Rhodoferax sp.]MDO8318166.1 A24 family peptidase [Rhodoferax sp.]MDP2677960.1 A24 family peptidase [Rhodoferax sp.]OGB40856.1 MAG: methyltransferase [Burkholderiales bacterium RIFOXYC2_FULL_59_8]OGB60002.1 MAG: methyltransferase [Burkholderiales bacterium RIFOXYD12_FULL_59_19]
MGTHMMDASLLGLLGLLIGSFLNVVIYRLPVMLEAQWKAECADLQGQSQPESPPFNLMAPRSRCQACSHQLGWYENIPLLSYLVLRGKCHHCKAAISLRYPAVELITGLLFLWCGWQYGASATGLAWCGFCAVLLALTLIDWDTTLLPDDLTLPLLWAGLIAAALQLTPIQLTDALWGAVAGYLSLWLVYWAFKLATGKEGMGYGDFKLFAALGAWFGWQALVPIILMASVIGAVVGVGLKFSKNLREGGYVPFGPFLSMAGLTAMVAGPTAMLRFVGL